MAILFVYGTLLEGEHYAGQFDNRRKQVAYAKLTGYKMYDTGAYPVIKFTGNPKNFVLGELHLYDDFGKVLEQMDRIEGYNPHKPKDSLFIREIVSQREGRTQYVRLGGKKHKVYVYSFNGDIKNKLDVYHGDWKRYQKDRSDRQKGIRKI